MKCERGEGTEAPQALALCATPRRQGYREHNYLVPLRVWGGVSQLQEENDILALVYGFSLT